MMLDWLFAPPAERRLLGQSRMRGAMPWVIAIMSFSIMIIAATGLALASTAATLTRAIEARYSVEVPAGGNLDAALQAVRAAPGVTSSEAVSESKMRQTLERWLGREAQSRELPVPGLIHFNLQSNARLGTLEARVSSAAPGARILAHRDSVGPLLRSLRLLQWIAFGLVAMLTGAAAAAVVLAARGALDTHRSTIDVMHGVGATDLQVTHLFQRRIAIDALAGSVGGAIAAAIVLALIATVASFTTELTAAATLGAWDLVVLALLPLALAGLVTLVARTAVLTALRQSL
ncbi:MAG: cell division protein [Sphingomicrobium sp.]